MSADRYPTRTTNAQAEILKWMEERGAQPTLALGMPGSTIDLGDLDREWRKAHNEQPVDPRTLQGLVNRGLVQSETRRIGLRSFRVWTLADSHRDKLGATPNGAGSLTEA